MRLVVGRIGRPHGLRGEVVVEVSTDDPEHRFAPGAILMTDPGSVGPLTVVSRHMHSGRLLLEFTGVADRTAAEALRGVVLLVDVDPQASSPDADEYYDHQLTGLTVVTVMDERGEARTVGTVSEVLHLPGQDVLAVRDAAGGDVLIPFVMELVPQVDMAAGRIVIDPPPGLLVPLDCPDPE